MTAGSRLAGLQQQNWPRPGTGAIAALGVFALSLLIYVRTLVPGPTFGDWAEMQFVPSQLGIPHPTGYPLYRLEWQRIGSLRRRLRNCVVGMRASPYADDAAEIVDLELYLAWRAGGLVMETPAVRP